MYSRDHIITIFEWVWFIIHSLEGVFLYDLMLSLFIDSVQTITSTKEGSSKLRPPMKRNQSDENNRPSSAASTYRQNEVGVASIMPNKHDYSFNTICLMM